MSSQTFFLSTICLNAKGKLRPHFAIRYFPLFMQHLELKRVMFSSLVASVQHVSLLLCFPHQDVANHLALLFISRRQQHSSFRVCVLYHHSRSGFVHHCCAWWVGPLWRGTDDTAIYLFLRFCVKGTVGELLLTRGASASARYCTVLRCFERNSMMLCVSRAEERVWWLLLCLFRLSSLVLWDYKLNTCKHCQTMHILIFFPHNRSVPALMTFLSGDIPYTGSA